MIENAKEWAAELQKAADSQKVEQFSRFFKTGKGEYGENDLFIGITVPANRAIAKKAIHASYPTIEEMLASPIHEYRLSALLVLVERYKKAKNDAEKAEIAAFYLAHTANINNWDLVDLSAEYILGAEMLRTGSDETLRLLAGSANLWEQRISIVSNLIPIRNGKFDTALAITTRLLHHKHDLIQKANGWILREIGKKDETTLLRFLDNHATVMPRTTLRYAIERLPEPMRKDYLSRR